MVIGIGCDIVEHETTRRLNWDKDIIFLHRILSQKEIDIYNSNKELKFITGRFAVKEAVLKCFSTGMYDGIALSQIQVLKSENGKPILELTGLAKQISVEMGINLWHVTITHSSNYSLALVIAERI